MNPHHCKLFFIEIHLIKYYTDRILWLRLKVFPCTLMLKFSIITHVKLRFQSVHSLKPANYKTITKI